MPPILNRMETFEDPPTYNRTNKFTFAFQTLINAYGIASYREVNPGMNNTYLLTVHVKLFNVSIKSLLIVNF